VSKVDWTSWSSGLGKNDHLDDFVSNTSGVGSAESIVTLILTLSLFDNKLRGSDFSLDVDTFVVLDRFVILNPLNLGDRISGNLGRNVKFHTIFNLLESKNFDSRENDIVLACDGADSIGST
jgi:hypothetical protein